MTDQFLAAVDLGSNSFRVEIGRVVDGRIVQQNYHKETIRLAACYDQNGAITEAAQKRALDCLARFNERLANLPAHCVRAVGTQVFREALNADEFLAKAEQALGYPIEILSGHEEARLVYTGCRKLLPPSDNKRLIIDIGGASTEFVLGRNTDVLFAESFHIGCVNTSLRFFADGVISETRLKQAVTACQAELEEIAGQFLSIGIDEAFGSAGTFGAVSELCQRFWGDPIVTPERLHDIRKKLLKFEHVNQINFAGLKEDRREVIPGGLAILLAIFDSLKIKAMKVAPGALRMGILYDLLGRDTDEDPRQQSVQALAKQANVSSEQAQLVCSLAEKIVLGLVPEFSPKKLQLLKWAAQLHEVGMMISSSKYHRHSAYIVSNSDMPGFSTSEQDWMAQLVLGQRGRLSKLGDRLKSKEFLLSVLALRLAVILAHARVNIDLPQLTTRMNKSGMELLISEAWMQEHPLTRFLLDEETKAWENTDFHLKVTTLTC